MRDVIGIRLSRLFFQLTVVFRECCDVRLDLEAQDQ